MNYDVISIREIQHFLYCPHRWGLIQIGKIWSENTYVTKANLQHQRVHDCGVYSSCGKKKFTSISVYNDSPSYNLYGVTDCIELKESPFGVKIDESEKKYDLCIVEYKPTKPKNIEYNNEDLMQVFAQKICADYVFGCKCSGVIYYQDVKMRIQLPLKENFPIYDSELKNILKKMRNFAHLGKIPPIKIGQVCSGCSIKDICIPKIKKIGSVRKSIEEFAMKE